MPRPCQRARLESGLKLDLNWLIRHRVIVPGYSLHVRAASRGVTATRASKLRLLKSCSICKTRRKEGSRSRLGGSTSGSCWWLVRVISVAGSGTSFVPT